MVHNMKNYSVYLSFAKMSAALCLLATGTLVSCTEDAMPGLSHNDDVLRFSLSEKNWNKVTKGRTGTDFDNYTVGVVALQDDNKEDSLFLHIQLSDGMNGMSIAQNRLDTKAGPVETADFYESFGVLTSIYSGAWDETTCLPDYMYNVEVTKESSWTTRYFWPGANRNIRFFAYAPYNGDGVSLSAATEKGTPSLTYTVPGSVNRQKDLLVAASAEMSGKSGAAAPLKFYHSLTAVRFAVGDRMLAGKITEISIKSVYGTAKHKFGEDKWTDYGSTSDFTFTCSVDVNGSPSQSITSSEETFMMIPQILPEGATIEVKFTDALTSTLRTLTASIAGTTWPMGKTVTYKISTTSISVVPVFEVTEPTDFEHSGGNASYSVRSYATVSRPGDPQKEATLGWRAEFIEADETGGYNVIAQPSWITAFTTNGSGSKTSQAFTATAAAQIYRIFNPHNDALKAAPAVSGVYDLSTDGGTKPMTTANCYIINAPGTYSLPLVYGNAIKNGLTNAQSYDAPTSLSSYALKKFVNHLDAQIKDPYIYNNKITVQDAVLVWQDADNLIQPSSIKLSSDGHYLQFTVPQESIRQGNALIAARDNSGKIVWSWHIWVTDYKLAEGDRVITNAYDVQYSAMPVNIGWCDGETKQYDSREVKVRFTQDITGATRIISLNQLARTETTRGNCPYFQFGRKDAILPADFNKTPITDKDYYSKEYVGKVGAGPWTAKITIGTSIQNPNYYYCGGTSDWCYAGNKSNSSYYNLWNATSAKTDANDDIVVKTIYDPSPAGYCIPASNAFTGCGYNGQANTSDFNMINTPFKSSEEYDEVHGWEIYCKKMTASGSYDATGGTIFLPACGQRTWSSFKLQSEDQGQYWLANPFASSDVDYPYANARGFSFSNQKFFSLSGQGGSRTNGKAIRAVREK